MIDTNKLISLYNKTPNLPAKFGSKSCNGKKHKLIGTKWKNCNKQAFGRKSKPKSKTKPTDKQNKSDLIRIFKKQKIVSKISTLSQLSKKIKSILEDKSHKHHKKTMKLIKTILKKKHIKQKGKSPKQMWNSISKSVSKIRKTLPKHRSKTKVRTQRKRFIRKSKSKFGANTISAKFGNTKSDIYGTLNNMVNISRQMLNKNNFGWWDNTQLSYANACSGQQCSDPKNLGSYPYQGNWPYVRNTSKFGNKQGFKPIQERTLNLINVFDLFSTTNPKTTKFNTNSSLGKFPQSVMSSYPFR